MSTEPRELFPITFLGSRGDSPQQRVESPDLGSVPEPTEAELAALESGDEPEIITPEAAAIPDPPVDPDPDLAGAVGKGKGAASKA